MSIPLPKIIYNGTTLLFTYPPVNKPGADILEAQRTDTITSSGKKQTVNLRTDTFKTLENPNVPFADLAGWQAFMAWALPGGVFTYYPDASDAATHDDWTLEDTKWTPVRAYPGFSRFTFTMRKVV
jgi:hypothetical protein